MLRPSARPSRWFSALVLLLVGIGTAGLSAAQQILESYNDSLTTYLPTGNTAIQNVRPLHTQRGVNLEGSWRAGPGLAMALAGNPFENIWTGKLSQGALRIDVGAYAPMDVDIALPAKGFSWVIGRTYNAVQQTSGGSPRDSDGYQGANWFQASQPEIVLFAGATADKDVLYLVYGADRYVEYQRTGLSSNDFKGKNGAAGVFVFASGGGNPDTYTLTDQKGNEIVFFGFNGPAGSAAGQLWKMSDPDGNVAYVGDSSTASTAISNGFSSGKILKAYDTSDRRYTYTYTTLDSVSRLTQVKAETKSGGTWASPTGLATLGQVDYTYYVSTDSDIANGSAGDLKKVTITDNLDDSGVTQTKKKYYRYWKGSYNSSTNPGYPHALWYVFDFEGVRAFDWAGDSTFDEDFLSATESNLKPYAAAYFEYDSSHRVRKAWFEGGCGCSGASNGTHEYTFESNPSYSDSSGYQTTWARRTVVKRPDGSYLTEYFDETNQGVSQVTTDADPAGSPHKWVTAITRDGSGLVTRISTPANVTSYTHNTGAPAPDGTIATSSSVGLVRAFTRETSGNMTGFLSCRKYKEGTSPTPSLEEKLTWTSTSKTVGSSTLVRPLISAKRVYHTATTSDSSNYYETTFSYGYYSSPALLSVESVTTSYPVVSTGNNGSNAATTKAVHYKKDSAVDFEKDEAGIITYHAYTNGLETTLTRDADTTSLSPPSGFSHTGTPLNLTTTSSYSPNGHWQLITPPSNVDKQYRTKLADERLVVLQYADFQAGSPDTFFGPVRYSVYNQAGKVEAQGTIALSSNQTTSATTAHIDETKSDAIEAVATGSAAQLRTSVYSGGGTQLDEERIYFSIPSSLPGTEGTHYDSTRFGYDDSGRRWRTKEANGTIWRTVFDSIGRRIEQWIGTNDHSFTGGESSGTDNMVKTEILEYDSGSDMNNGLLTKRTERVEATSTDERVTDYTSGYDYRGRRILEINATAPHALRKYDNLGREIARGLYSSSSGLSASSDPTSTSSNRLALSQTFFDEAGRVWKSQRHQITQSNGTDADNLQTLSWRDRRGHIVKVDGAELKKTKYDRVGRMTDEYVLAVDDDSAYANVVDNDDSVEVSGDIVLEERQTRFDATTGTVIQRARIDRFHSDISTGETTGPLDTNGDGNALTITSSNIKGRIQATAYYYDRTERETDRVEYGIPTYASGAWTRPSSQDARSDTVLRTTTAYNSDGTVDAVTDPKALVMKRFYDAEGRLTKEARNYDAGVNSGNPYGTDQNVTVTYGYTKGLRTNLTAKMPSGGTDQVTTYIYGGTKGTPSQMKIASGHLLRGIKYPDSTNSGTSVANIDSDSSDIVSFAYNAQGQETYKKDQAGNEFEPSYDTAGRTTQKRVTTVASGFDSAIRRIAITYDNLGRTSEVVQYDNATVGSGTAQDGVKYSYDDWSNVSQYEEDRNSAVSGGGDQYATSYTWIKATTGRNTLRKASMTMPDGRAITYTYRSTGGLHDAETSRVSTVVDGGSVTMAQYDYNGLGQVVRTKLNEAGVMWQEYTSTTGDYPDLDRFNRVVSSRWTKILSTNRDFYSVTLTNDRDSNITSAKDNVHAGFDVNYSMDNVNRLTRAEEGTLSGGSITSRTRDQQWTLSHTGNWDVDKVDLNGDLAYGGADELNDSRTHNAVNELTARDKDSNSSDDYTLTYDASGNMTDDGKAYTYVYDPFNRLRKVRNRSNSNLLAEYRYNGLGHRIGIHEDTDTSGLVDSSDRWYYDAFDERWRTVAKYRESDANPKEDLVPHQAGVDGRGGASYIDLVICRNKDANTAWTSSSDGVLEERVYYCQNWRADVSTIITSSGMLSEWVKYSGYGVPFGLPGGDANSNGATDTTDENQVQTWINGSTYDVRGDIDLDGDVDSTDKSTISNTFTGTQLGRMILSANGVRNRRGFAGYEYNPNIVDKYTVRRRIFAAALGRWLTRDPAMYIDGRNLYQAFRSAPISKHDFTGLGSCQASILRSAMDRVAFHHPSAILT